MFFNIPWIANHAREVINIKIYVYIPIHYWPFVKGMVALTQGYIFSPPVVF